MLFKVFPPPLRTSRIELFWRVMRWHWEILHEFCIRVSNIDAPSADLVLSNLPSILKDRAQELTSSSLGSFLASRFSSSQTLQFFARIPALEYAGVLEYGDIGWNAKHYAGRSESTIRKQPIGCSDILLVGDRS